MTTYTTTLTAIRAARPCKKGWEKLLAHLGKTKADDEPLPLLTVLDSNGLDDALWVLSHAMRNDAATPDERAAARAAAWDAAWAAWAAWDAWAAGDAGDAASAAARDAARDAAWDAAWTAAWVAAWAAQEQQLRKMLTEGI